MFILPLVEDVPITPTAVQLPQFMLSVDSLDCISYPVIELAEPPEAPLQERTTLFSAKVADSAKAVGATQAVIIRGELKTVV